MGTHLIVSMEATKHLDYNQKDVSPSIEKVHDIFRACLSIRKDVTHKNSHVSDQNS